MVSLVIKFFWFQDFCNLIMLSSSPIQENLDTNPPPPRVLREKQSYFGAQEFKIFFLRYIYIYPLYYSVFKGEMVDKITLFLYVKKTSIWRYKLSRKCLFISFFFFPFSFHMHSNYINSFLYFVNITEFLYLYPNYIYILWGHDSWRTVTVLGSHVRRP